MPHARDREHHVLLFPRTSCPGPFNPDAASCHSTTMDQREGSLPLRESESLNVVLAADQTSGVEYILMRFRLLYLPFTVLPHPRLAFASLKQTPR